MSFVHDLPHNTLLQDRYTKLQRLKSLGVTLYPKNFEKKTQLAAVSYDESAFRDIETVIDEPQRLVSTAGRIVLSRSFGKILFFHLQDESGRLQCMISRDHLSMMLSSEVIVSSLSDESGEISAFKVFEKLIDLGDFVGVEGEMFRTHK